VITVRQSLKLPCNVSAASRPTNLGLPGGEHSGRIGWILAGLSGAGVTEVRHEARTPRSTAPRRHVEVCLVRAIPLERK